MRNIAIILAGGVGKRVGGSIPKQFRSIAGKTILEHTIDKFENHNQIDEITLVVSAAQTQRVQEIIGQAGYKKIRHIAEGGRERYHSTLSALNIYKGTPVNLLIHDAVRPMVTDRIISEVIAALSEYKAVNVAIPATDTIIETDPTHSFLNRVPERERLYQVQTPQGFYMPVLYAAYQKALEDPGFKTTDDCGVILKYLPEEKIKIVRGETTNLKFTYEEDLFLLEYLLKK